MGNFGTSPCKWGFFRAGEASCPWWPLCTERHLMGIAHWCRLGWLAGEIPVFINLLSPIQQVGQNGRIPKNPWGSRPWPWRAWGHKPLGMLHWRHVRGGKKRGAKVGKTKRGKGTKLMVIADASGLPLALHTDSAGPHEVTLVQAALDEIVTVGQPRRIIGDRAYDSDPLDNALAAQGIEMIAPHRRNRKRKATQDGRPLRRYRRRWKIERLFAWLNTFKRTMARWDRFHQHFTAFVHLAFSMILLRRVIKELWNDF